MVGGTNALFSSVNGYSRTGPYQNLKKTLEGSIGFQTTGSILDLSLSVSLSLSLSICYTNKVAGKSKMLGMFLDSKQ